MVKWIYLSLRELRSMSFARGINCGRLGNSKSGSLRWKWRDSLSFLAVSSDITAKLLVRFKSFRLSWLPEFCPSCGSYRPPASLWPFFQSQMLEITNNRVGEGTLPWAIFRFRIFSNYLLQNYYVWKFLFSFVLILVIKSASKKIWHLAQGRVLDPCLGPYICISTNTK